MPTQAYLRDPEIHSGAAAFAGTRVAVWVLFNWLAAGKSLDDFLDTHPQVERAAALAALDEASRALVGQDSRGECALLSGNELTQQADLLGVDAAQGP